MIRGCMVGVEGCSQEGCPHLSGHHPPQRMSQYHPNHPWDGAAVSPQQECAGVAGCMLLHTQQLHLNKQSKFYYSNILYSLHPLCYSTNKNHQTQLYIGYHRWYHTRRSKDSDKFKAGKKSGLGEGGKREIWCKGNHTHRKLSNHRSLINKQNKKVNNQFIVCYICHPLPECNTGTPFQQPSLMEPQVNNSATEI